MEIFQSSEMLKRYYSTIKLVWIPRRTARGKGLDRPHEEIYLQVQRLHAEIRSASRAAQNLKAAGNLLLSTLSFQDCTKRALENFARHEFLAFNLEARAGAVRPAPRIFREHVGSVILFLNNTTPDTPDERDSQKKLLA